MLETILQSNLIWQILILLGMLMIFRSVPKELVEKLDKSAKETTNPYDDIGVALIEYLQSNPEWIDAIRDKINFVRPANSPVGEDILKDIIELNGDNPALPRESITFNYSEYGTREIHQDRGGGENRNVDVPANAGYTYDFHNFPGSPGVHPDTFIKDEYGGAKMALADKSGAFGYTWKSKLAKGRYQVLLSYSVDLKWKPDETTPLNEAIHCRLYLDGKKLEEIAIPELSGQHEAIWTIDIEESGEYLLKPMIAIPIARFTDHSYFTFHLLEINPQ